MSTHCPISKYATIYRAIGYSRYTYKCILWSGLLFHSFRSPLVVPTCAVLYWSIQKLQLVGPSSWNQLPLRGAVAFRWCKCSVPSVRKVASSNPCTSRHVGTFGKSFTCSCLYDVMRRPAWLPCSYIRLL